MPVPDSAQRGRRQIHTTRRRSTGHRIARIQSSYCTKKTVSMRWVSTGQRVWVRRRIPLSCLPLTAVIISGSLSTW
eukprot:2822140-Rhodomonas_salina.3